MLRFALLLTAAVAPVRAIAEEAAEVFVMLREPPAARSHDLGTRRGAIAAQRLRVLREIEARGVRLREPMSVVSGFSASVTAEGMAALQAHPEVRSVDPMRYGSGGLDHSVPQIRADAVYRRDDGGQDVTVAVLDTGVQATHPDVAGRVVGEQCFCSDNCCPNGHSQQSGSGSAFTTMAHGIHVTGIVASRGSVSPRGVAPRVNVVAVKVLSDDNRGWLIDWIRGLQWIVENRPDVQAVNMSLVSDATYTGFCDDTDSYNMAFAQVIEQLRARGTLTFVASGNTGDLDQISSPACVQDAVAVGAVDRNDAVADFTSRSRALDLLAPGVAILSDAPNASTAYMTGTSMAAPHATGTAALLRAWHPDLSADAVEALMKQTGKPVRDPFTLMVTPRINALAAFTAMMPASRPFLGGGSGRTDCLLEWQVAAAAGVRVAPRLRMACRDGDSTCDVDVVAGQCTLELNLCFNVDDVRLPRCQSVTAVERIDIFRPSAGSSDPVDFDNAAALSAALPALPTSGVGACTAPVRLTVPVGKPKQIRMAATAADGRRDFDQVVLVCQP